MTQASPRRLHRHRAVADPASGQTSDFWTGSEKVRLIADVSFLFSHKQHTEPCFPSLPFPSVVWRGKTLRSGSALMSGGGFPLAASHGTSPQAAFIGLFSGLFACLGPFSSWLTFVLHSLGSSWLPFPRRLTPKPHRPSPSSFLPVSAVRDSSSLRSGNETSKQ